LTTPFADAGAASRKHWRKSSGFSNTFFVEIILCRSPQYFNWKEPLSPKMANRGEGRGSKMERGSGCSFSGGKGADFVSEKNQSKEKPQLSSKGGTNFAENM